MIYVEEMFSIQGATKSCVLINQNPVTCGRRSLHCCFCPFKSFTFFQLGNPGKDERGNLCQRIIFISQIEKDILFSRERMIMANFVFEGVTLGKIIHFPAQVTTRVRNKKKMVTLPCCLKKCSSIRLN